MCGVCPAALPCKQVRLMRDHSREGRIRTGDLLGMNQASFQLLHIAIPAAGVAMWRPMKFRRNEMASFIKFHVIIISRNQPYFVPTF